MRPTVLSRWPRCCRIWVGRMMRARSWNDCGPAATSIPKRSIGAWRCWPSTMALQARMAAAGLLLDNNKRAEAFALVDDLANNGSQTSFDLVVQKAHLMADHGDSDGALALLSAAAQSYPCLLYTS